MPRAPGRPTHILYGPKSRLTGFPEATWSFLLQTAANLARAFAAVHDHDLVIGDVNHGNSLVSDRATVTLIDCDSFQVTLGSRMFFCGVGVETHTPPELQGRDLSRVLRTPHHDAFGLAVLVFQILFMGRHPFSGRFLGPGDMPIPRAIRELRFAYGPGAPARHMEPPPNTLPLSAVSSDLTLLFERAFSATGSAETSRPAAREWVEQLVGLARQLQVCKRNRSHHFFPSQGACPWCEIESRAGILFFGLSGSGAALGPGTFQLALVWARIAALAPPGPAPALPDPRGLRASASPAAVREGWWHRGRIFLAICSGLAGIVLSVSAGQWLIAVFGLVFAFWISQSGSYPERDNARQELTRAEAELKRLMEAWQRDASTLPFDAKLRELEQKRSAYLDLPSARQRGISKLQASLRQRQFERYLDRHRIERTRVKGIGPARRATLQSYGIETAADVNAAAIWRIPGFGPAMAQSLMDWRRSIERSFVFDASRGIDPADLRALESGLDRERAQLESDLKSGATQLEQIRHLIEVRRQSLPSEIAATGGRIAQAKANLRGL